MIKTRKRNTRWSSKGIFRAITGNRVRVVQPSDVFENNAVMSLDGCSTEDSSMLPRVAGKMQRSGSSLPSLVGKNQDTGSFCTIVAGLLGISNEAARQPLYQRLLEYDQ